MIIDYSFFRPTIQMLKDASVTAVGRYIGWNSVPGYGSPEHNIDKAEAEELTGNGISVFLCFEYAAAAVMLGAPQGDRDGKLASEQLAELGAPASMTVYFAIDFDIPDFAPNSTDPKAKLGHAAAYFEAINALHPGYKVGVYGGYYAVSRVLSAGLAAMGWQTSAWSGGQWDKRAVLQQLGTQVWGTNADVDLHVPRAADFGQWPRPPAHQPAQFRADGHVSLREAARQHGETVSRLIWLTAQHKPGGYGPLEVSYISAGQWDKPMPAGMIFWA
jgi:Rv2525c-like, glycoside hydrolase-like domain